MPIESGVTLDHHLDHALIRLSGEFDIDQSEALDRLAESLFAQFTATVEVDMQGVTFFGSRALASLLRLNNEVARHSGAEMRVTGFNDQVRRLFEMTGVVEVLSLGMWPTTMSHVA